MYITNSASEGGSDSIQQSQVSSSEPGPTIFVNNILGSLALEVSFICFHATF